MSPTDNRFEPLNPEFRTVIREQFERQGLLRNFDAKLLDIEPGSVTIAAPTGPEVSQQDGFPHAGFGWSLGDSAAGFAALSLMAAGERVLTVEMKTNLLAPAVGQRVIARGRVLRFGRSLCVVQSDLFSEAPDGEKHVAVMLGTMIRS
ncbi:MAG: PaaI family thioesterase [Rhodobacteraceae bacterium]|nr:PaaI family thioesterase [Paracoccaceae bacterium]